MRNLEPKKIIAAILLIIILTISYASAQKKKTEEKELPLPIQMEEKAMNSLRSGKILLNFDDADIKVVAKLMSELTGKNIVLDDKVKGRMTILSAREVSVTEAWKLFKSALKSYGFEVVNKGSYVKIIARNEIKTERARFYSEENVQSDDYLVAVVALKNVDPNQVAVVLKPLCTDVGVVTPHVASKSILIADESFNVKRLIKIARFLDSRKEREEMKTYKLRYASSESVYKALKDVYKPDEKAVKISDYTDNNSIVVMATREQLIEIGKIIEKLDKKSENLDTRKFRVHYLQNANAEDIAKIISTMLKEGESVTQKTIKATTKKTGSDAAAGSPDQAVKEKSFLSNKVSSDEETNSLVMYLTDTEYNEVKTLIGRLDTPRRQVLVSAVIAEVSLKRLMTTGANWQAISDKGYGGAFGGGKSVEAIYQTLASGNFILGGYGSKTQTINIGGRKIEYPNVFVLLSFLNEDNDFNLLSAPRVLTLDHKEAKINVGSIIPFATGVKFDTNGQPIVTYDYKDVGLTLTITPHVSQGQFIKMVVNQKIQDVTDYIQQNLGATGYVVPVVATREIDTNITVGDSQTIIIGGLVSKKTIDSIQKVPLLGDLPIIGTAFKNRKKEHQKTTLFIFLTPHIIETPDKLTEITEKYQHFVEEAYPQKGKKVKDPEEDKNSKESREVDR